MGISDAYGQRKKHEAMADTWGHMYPEPGSKWYGELIIAVSDYGDLVIIKTDFPGLDYSPQRYTVEQTVFDRYSFEAGAYRVSCGMWFFKTCHNMYRGEATGKLINIKVEEIEM